MSVLIPSLGFARRGIAPRPQEVFFYGVNRLERDALDSHLDSLRKGVRISESSPSSLSIGSAPGHSKGPSHPCLFSTRVRRPFDDSGSIILDSVIASFFVIHIFDVRCHGPMHSTLISALVTTC